MGINRDKPDLWKEDINKSVDFYNSWFLKFAPEAFSRTRISTAGRVEGALLATSDLENISPEVLAGHPEILQILRMSTCPPIARDRLAGLAGVSSKLVARMEDSNNIPSLRRLGGGRLDSDLERISRILIHLLDRELFPWLGEERKATRTEIKRSSLIVADRLCGSLANPIIRNEQEKRQLASIASLLTSYGYSKAETGVKYNEMRPGTYAFHTNVKVRISPETEKETNIPVDVLIQPKSASFGDLPLMIEAKSAGDFANVNKRRKEEAMKMTQLKGTFGRKVSYNLFLCGFFDSGYLGYEAAEGIDWIWEHRIEDLKLLGL